MLQWFSGDATFILLLLLFWFVDSTRYLFQSVLVILHYQRALCVYVSEMWSCICKDGISKIKAKLLMIQGLVKKSDRSIDSSMAKHCKRSQRTFRGTGERVLLWASVLCCCLSIINYCQWCYFRLFQTTNCNPIDINNAAVRFWAK